MPESLPFLLVGLGNPGPQYEWTPHNFGFLLVEELARRSGIRLKTHECSSLTGRGQLAGHSLWLAQPLTYMNLSGTAIAALLGKQEVAGWMVACDELDLPLGTLRLKERGSAGSHNGLKSVVESLGSTGFARLRLGIGPPHRVDSLGRAGAPGSPALPSASGSPGKAGRGPAPVDRVGFVLGRWGKAQQAVAAEVVQTAADAVEMVLTEGMARAMNKYNAPPDVEEQ